MRTTLAVFAAGMILLLATLPVLAHHAFSAEFDNTKPLVMKGKFTKMDWVNPHSWVHFEVVYSDGKVLSWAAETPPPNVLYRNGWRKDFLKHGDEIQVRGFAAKDGTTHMWAQQVTMASTGQVVLSMTSPNPNTR